ncbi:MAG TPA: TraB/GumN family protein, partial [Opitutales bacterium]|nr:TraB/GumN family protein [Opitutales bacterium]
MMLKTGNRIGGQWVVVVACALWILAGAGVVQAAPGSFPLAFEARKGDHTITLLGTIHAGESKMYPMPRALYDALQASDALVFEIDIDPDALSGVESL